MDIKGTVVKQFKWAVKNSPNCTPELRDKLLNGKHDRVNKFLQNLAKELIQAQNLRVKQKKSVFKEKTIKDAVTDFTEVFIQGIEQEANERMASDLKRLSIKQKQDDIKDMESTLAGKPKGAFEEMGLSTTDERDQSWQDQGSKLIQNK